MIENTGDWPLLGVTVPNEASLTVNDVALDIVLESEARSNAGDVTLTWLRSVDKRTGLPLWEQGDSSGHRCCILRVASWTKGLAPMAATISAFWKLYRSACEKAAEDFRGEELKVLIVDIGAECRPSAPNSVINSENSVDYSNLRWGVGDRSGFIILLNYLIRHFDCAVKASKYVAHNTMQSPSAVKNSNNADPLSDSSVHRQHRVCFSEADTIVPAEGEESAPIKPVSSRARGGVAPALDSGHSSDKDHRVNMRGLGLTGQDMMNLFSSIVEQHSCTDTAHSVMKNLERTEVATRLREENMDVRKQLASQRLALRLRERKLQREESANDSDMSINPRDTNGMVGDFPVPPAVIDPVMPPVAPTNIVLNSLRIDESSMTADVKAPVLTVDTDPMLPAEEVEKLRYHFKEVTNYFVNKVLTKENDIATEQRYVKWTQSILDAIGVALNDIETDISRGLAVNETLGRLKQQINVVNSILIVANGGGEQLSNELLITDCQYQFMVESLECRGH